MRISERPVALVTGAARRVGRVIARTLHQAGYDLVVHCRNSLAEAEQLAVELEIARKDSVMIHAADLTQVPELSKLVLRTVQRFGRLDVLVNNASAFAPTPVGTTTEAQFDELFASNAKAPYFLSQAAAPHLRAAKGCIVNLVDIYAERPLPHHPVYGMSKAALAMMTRSLALELAPSVRVNGISPGAVLWPESGKSLSDKQGLVARTPLRRTGAPEDVAAAVLYLVRDAGFVTGEILRVDGGRTLTG